MINDLPDSYFNYKCTRLRIKRFPYRKITFVVLAIICAIETRNNIAEYTQVKEVF